jgi:hypothetical protein
MNPNVATLGLKILPEVPPKFENPFTVAASGLELETALQTDVRGFDQQKKQSNGKSQDNQHNNEASSTSRCLALTLRT